MSHSSLKKKLQPAKKAWKSFVKKMDSKLHNLSFSKAINAIKTNSDRLLSYCSFHLFRFFKKRSIKSPPYHHRCHHHHYKNYHYRYNYSKTNNKKQDPYQNFLPIYIDQLYSFQKSGSSTSSREEASSSSSTSNNSIKKDKEKVMSREEDNKGKEKILYTIEDAWREVVAKSPQLRAVDDRTEEFISKFHQEIKLQKQKSILEFEEMLARGT